MFLGISGYYDQVSTAKWEIPDFSPRIGDLTYSYFPNRCRFNNEDLIHKKSIEMVVKFH